MLLAPSTWGKQRLTDVKELTNSHTGRLRAETGLQKTRPVTGLVCLVLPHFLLFSIGRKLQRTFRWSCTPCYPS